VIRTPPATIRAQGFMHELRWNLRHNWAWYVAVAAVSLLVGYLL
jgi:hypothetical protein